MFTDPLGLFALFSLLPGYQTPAYRSEVRRPVGSWGPSSTPSPWLPSTAKPLFGFAPLERLLAPQPAPPAPTAAAPVAIPAVDRSGGPMLILTEASDYVVPLMKEGLAGLLEDAEWTEHWHVFCADEKSFTWCRAEVRPASACRRTAETLRSAAYLQGDYLKHVWLKWALIRTALAGELGPVGSVLFLDADVAVLSGGRVGLEQCLLRPMKGTGQLPHFQYQQSPYDGVNGGVLWFRKDKLSLDFVDSVYAQREHKRSGDDQAWANHYLRQPQFGKHSAFRARPLPRTLFHSFCMERQWHMNLSWHARTHHPTCRRGTDDKLRDVRRARKQWHESLMGAIRQGIAGQDPCALM